MTKLTAAKLRFFDALTTAPELTHLDCRVAWRLLHYHNAQHGHAWPSLVTLTVEVHCSRRSVLRAVDRLEAQGWFTVEHRRGRGQSNRYVANLDNVTEQHLYKARLATSKGDSVTPLLVPGKCDSDARKRDRGTPENVTEQHPDSFKPLRTLEGTAARAADGAVVNPLGVISRECLAYLTTNGVKDNNARGLLGKWRRDYGPGVVIEIVSEASMRAVSEPVAWIEKALKVRTGEDDGPKPLGPL